jgi:hypothetical protein
MSQGAIQIIRDTLRGGGRRPKSAKKGVTYYLYDPWQQKRVQAKYFVILYYIVVTSCGFKQYNKMLKSKISVVTNST